MKKYMLYLALGILGLVVIIGIRSLILTNFSSVTAQYQISFRNYAMEGYVADISEPCRSQEEDCSSEYYYLSTMQVGDELLAADTLVPMYAYAEPDPAITTTHPVKLPVRQGAVQFPFSATWFNPTTNKAEQVMVTTKIDAAKLRRQIDNNGIVAMSVYLRPPKVDASDALPTISFKADFYKTGRFSLEGYGSPVGPSGILGRETVEIKQLPAEKSAELREQRRRAQTAK